MTYEDQLLIYFFKLKSNQSFVSIGLIFDVNQKTVSEIFKYILEAHHNKIKGYMWWLTKEEVTRTMPESFKLHYPDTRVIIDASEIKIQCPKNVRAGVLCYSSYKSAHTAKFLIGIAPCGIITFMSEAYGGRVTDSHLTTESGILDLLEPGKALLTSAPRFLALKRNPTFP